MRAIRIALVASMISSLVACNPQPVSSFKQQAHSPAPARHAKKFRAMTLTPCDCLDQSIWGQSMRDSYTYTVAGPEVAGDSTNSTYVYDVAFDSLGNMFYIDHLNYKVKMVPREDGSYYGISNMNKGQVYTVVGTGSYNATSSADGTLCTSVDFLGGSIAFDGNDTMYIIDHNQVRVIPRDSGITLFGVATQPNKIYSIIGSGAYGNPAADGTDALSAYSWGFDDLVIDSQGNVILSDYNDHIVQMVPNSTNSFYNVSMTADKIYRIAGTGATSPLGDGGAARSASLYYPSGLALDANDNLYIADKVNHRVRTVARASSSYMGASRTLGNIYTIAGNGTAAFAGDGSAATGSSLINPTRLAFDSGNNLVIADTGNYRVRMVPSANVTRYGQDMSQNSIYTIAGGGSGSIGSMAVATNFGGSVFSVAIDGDDHLYLGTANRILTVPGCN